MPVPAIRSGSLAGVPVGKRTIAIFCGLCLAATLAPIVQNAMPEPEDGFPFSYYPMFSGRVGNTYDVTSAVGLNARGHEIIIPYRYLGEGRLNQVRVFVARNARRRPDALCRDIAALLVARGEGELRGVREVVLRTGRYDLQAFYAGEIRARSQREHARCPVTR